jgi:hypothetical protein
VNEWAKVLYKLTVTVRVERIADLSIAEARFACVVVLALFSHACIGQ